jgi:hypothetical protein
MKPNALLIFVWLLVRGAAAADTNWVPLFNDKDLANWEKWLGTPPGDQGPLGLNNDPVEVFSVVEKDGAPAIRVSGQVFGAITTRDEFENCHIRVEYKWGEKKWPPREQSKHYRDTGILYWCVGEHGAGSSAWMRSVECNIMERGVGQWWPVAGTFVDGTQSGPRTRTRHSISRRKPR